MEEILASIKKIIAQDGSSALAERRIRSRPVQKTAAEQAAANEEILELTDPFESEAEETMAVGTGTVSDDCVAKDEMPIVSDDAAEASRTALGALAAISSRAATQDEAAGSQALEDMVREMLRPMLKDWLDTNLPGIVDAMVQREIARIVGTES